MLRIRRAIRLGKPLNRSSNLPTQRWANYSQSNPSATLFSRQVEPGWLRAATPAVHRLFVDARGRDILIPSYAEHRVEPAM
jgi:hypothetical protein